jgi:CRISPR type III-B/RAMP module-associated protein Cmr5
MSIQHLHQLRAVYAFECTQKGADGDKYNKAVQELPALIRNNGLTNTLAYLYSKEGAHQDLFSQIQEWLIGQGLIQESRSPEHAKDINKTVATAQFMHKILNLDINEARVAQQEVLLLATWLFRLLKKDNANPLNMEENGASK